MRIITVVALFAVMLAGTAFAGDSGNGCKLQGTWIGETPYPLPDETPMDPTDNEYYMLKMVNVYYGTGDNDGIAVAEWINPVPDPGTSWSNSGRGVWEKSGPNKYEAMTDVYVYQKETGKIIVVGRHRDTITLTDCNTMEINGKIEVMTPDMTPVNCVSATKLIFKRVTMHQACEP